MAQLPVVPQQSIASVTLMSERVARYKLPAPLTRKPAEDRRRLVEMVSPEIEADVEKLHARVRHTFGYKRRDLTVDFSDASTARLQTPDFEYTVTVAPLEEDPAEARWVREVTLSRQAEGLQDARLLEALADQVDTVVIRFADPVDIERIIDRIEESDSDVQLDYDARCRWCEISGEGWGAVVRFEGNRMQIARRPGSDLRLSDMVTMAQLERLGLA